MKHTRITAVLLAFALIVSSVAIPASAADPLGFQVALSPSAAHPGDEVEVTVSLTGYTAEAAQADAIRGLQIDITGVDTDVLEVVEYTSLIEDTTAMSNTASYNAANKRVRLVYVQLSNTLPAPCADVFKTVFRIDPDLTGDGSITLPITVKIQTVSQQITLTDEITIRYTAESASTFSVDLTWGAMDFTYTDGVWDPQTLSYTGAGWSDSNTGFITVKNTGDITATAEFSYDTDRTDISGSFTDGTKTISAPVAVTTGNEVTAHLVLSGKPSGNLNNVTVGSVTIALGKIN